MKKDLEEIIRVSTIEAFKIRLNVANADNFINFLIHYFLNDCDMNIFGNKELNLGRYFALYKK